ncbi:MAG: nicotinate (nicotinamide) nucleotide adenylyltransferase [Acidimicrobiia bacterium]|nr:nicotinate (nicotinamide) nucleotide adenylyltransferase [Acidimicrobiia bacterium]
MAQAVGANRLRGWRCMNRCCLGERLGIFGGTFDPPHVGHLVCAVNVRYHLRLDRVLLVVNDLPWQKIGTRPISPAAQRLAMVEAAVADVDGLEASRIEIDAGGLSYTADTLARLRAESLTDDFFVVLGADAAAGLPTWERLDEVREQATIVVVERPGAAAVTPLEGFRWESVEVPGLQVSSTDLRARVSDGRPLDYLATREVVEWISAHNLYQDPV